MDIKLRQALITILFEPNNIKVDNVITDDIRYNYPGMDYDDSFDINKSVVVNDIGVHFTFGCYDNTGSYHEDDYGNAPYIKIVYACIYHQESIEVYIE